MQLPQACFLSYEHDRLVIQRMNASIHVHFITYIYILSYYQLNLKLKPKYMP